MSAERLELERRLALWREIRDRFRSLLELETHWVYQTRYFQHLSDADAVIGELELALERLQR